LHPCASRTWTLSPLCDITQPELAIYLEEEESRPNNITYFAGDRLNIPTPGVIGLMSGTDLCKKPFE